MVGLVPTIHVEPIRPLPQMRQQASPRVSRNDLYAFPPVVDGRDKPDHDERWQGPPMIDRLSLAFDPMLPYEVLAPLLIAALIGLLILALARAPGVGWRKLVVVVLALVLLNPSMVQESREPVKDVVLLVADRSSSLDLGRRKEQIDAAYARLRAALEARRDIELRTIEVPGTVEGSENPVESSRLFGAIDQALSDVPRRRLAGTLILTDGQVHDAPTAERAADSFGPLHVLLAGGPDETDRRLVLVNAPAYGIVGKTVTVKVRADQLPAEEDAASLPVTVTVNGGQPRTEIARPDADLTLTLPVEHDGQNVYELSVPELAGELTRGNNRLAVVVNGVRDRMRVLLVSGSPHAGERTWRSLLKADPSVDLVHFTILRSPGHTDYTPTREMSLIAFPVRELFEEKLADFDLLIFDRFETTDDLWTQYRRNVADYVRDGGALLEAPGPQALSDSSLATDSELGQLMPAEPAGDPIEEAFRPKLSDDGLRHPITRGLPGGEALIADPQAEPRWGRWLRQLDYRVRRGDVLMTGLGARPLLIVDRVGKGRVAQLTSDQIWLWNRGYDGGGPQAELLRRLAHWLMKEPELEENSLSARAAGNKIQVDRRRLDGAEAQVRFTRPDGTEGTVAMAADDTGHWTGTVEARQAGVWRFTDGSRTAVVAYGAANSPERRDVRATTEALDAAVTASNGSIRWLSADPEPDLRRLPGRGVMGGAGWIGLRENRDSVVRAVTEVSLLPPGLALLLIMAGLLAAWRREGR